MRILVMMLCWMVLFSMVLMPFSVAQQTSQVSTNSMPAFTPIGIFGAVAPYDDLREERKIADSEQLLGTFENPDPYEYCVATDWVPYARTVARWYRDTNPPHTTYEYSVRWQGDIPQIQTQPSVNCRCDIYNPGPFTWSLALNAAHCHNTGDNDDDFTIFGNANGYVLRNTEFDGDFGPSACMGGTGLGFEQALPIIQICASDNDHDGKSIRQGDCDDNDPARFPGNTEICDQKDNDCDGEVDEEGQHGCINYDTCAPYQTCDACPQAPAEVCGDDRDNNCNGQTDESCDPDEDPGLCQKPEMSWIPDGPDDGSAAENFCCGDDNETDCGSISVYNNEHFLCAGHEWLSAEDNIGEIKRSECITLDVTAMRIDNQARWIGCGNAVSSYPFFSRGLIFPSTGFLNITKEVPFSPPQTHEYRCASPDAIKSIQECKGLENAFSDNIGGVRFAAGETSSINGAQSYDCTDVAQFEPATRPECDAFFANLPDPKGGWTGSKCCVGMKTYDDNTTDACWFGVKIPLPSDNIAPFEDKNVPYSFFGPEDKDTLLVANGSYYGCNYPYIPLQDLRYWWFAHTAYTPEQPGPVTGLLHNYNAVFNHTYNNQEYLINFQALIFDYTQTADAFYISQISGPSNPTTPQEIFGEWFNRTNYSLDGKAQQVWRIPPRGAYVFSVRIDDPDSVFDYMPEFQQAIVYAFLNQGSIDAGDFTNLLGLPDEVVRDLIRRRVISIQPSTNPIDIPSQLDSGENIQRVSEDANVGECENINVSGQIYYCSPTNEWKQSPVIRTQRKDSPVLDSSMECCAADECWSSIEQPEGACVGEGVQRTFDMGTFFCSDGEWEEGKLRYDWEGNAGYCSGDSDCFVSSSLSDDTVDHCVPAGTYFGDLYCEAVNETDVDYLFGSGNLVTAGVWTSRTRLVANELWNYADTTKNITLYCDDIPLVANYVRSVPHHEQQWTQIIQHETSALCNTGNAEYLFLPNITAPCINNVCILRQADDSGEFVLLGTSVNNYPLEAFSVRFSQLPLSGNRQTDDGVVIFDLGQERINADEPVDFFRSIRNFINYIYVYLLLVLNSRQHLDFDIPVLANRIYTTYAVDEGGAFKQMSATVEPAITPGTPRNPSQPQEKMVISHVNFEADICGALTIPCRDFYVFRARPTDDPRRDMSDYYYEPNPGYFVTGDYPVPEVPTLRSQTVLSYYIDPGDDTHNLLFFQINDFDDGSSATNFINSAISGMQNAEQLVNPPPYAFTVQRSQILTDNGKTARLFFWQPQSVPEQLFVITLYQNASIYDPAIESQYAYRVIEAYYQNTTYLTTHRDIDSVAGVLMDGVWSRTAVLTYNEDIITENWQAIAPQTRLW